MDVVRVLILLVAMGFAVYAGQKSLTWLILAISPAAMRSWFLPAEKADQLVAISEELPAWLHRLEALGFSRLGIKAEKPPLRGTVYLEFSCVSIEDNAFASIVLDPRDGRPRSLYFYTPLTDGRFVLTRDGDFGLEIETQDASVKNVPSDDVSAVLASHEQRVQHFMQKGFVPRVGSGEQSRLEATHLYYASKYGRQSFLRLFLRSGGLLFLMAILLLIAVALGGDVLFPGKE